MCTVVALQEFRGSAVQSCFVGLLSSGGGGLHVSEQLQYNSAVGRGSRQANYQRTCDCGTRGFPTTHRVRSTRQEEEAALKASLLDSHKIMVGLYARLGVIPDPDWVALAQQVKDLTPGKCHSCGWTALVHSLA